jgi:N-methylhydantoinase A
VSDCVIDGCVRIGIDIGGTFTDLLLVDDATGAVTVVKTLTTPADPSNAVDAGVREALAASRFVSAARGT